jgi:uncharacterized membrane protein
MRHAPREQTRTLRTGCVYLYIAIGLGFVLSFVMPTLAMLITFYVADGSDRGLLFGVLMIATYAIAFCLAIFGMWRLFKPHPLHTTRDSGQGIAINGRRLLIAYSAVVGVLTLITFMSRDYYIPILDWVVGGIVLAGVVLYFLITIQLMRQASATSVRLADYKLYKAGNRCARFYWILLALASIVLTSTICAEAYASHMYRNMEFDPVNGTWSDSFPVWLGALQATNGLLLVLVMLFSLVMFIYFLRVIIKLHSAASKQANTSRKQRQPATTTPPDAHIPSA